MYRKKYSALLQLLALPVATYALALSAANAGVHDKTFDPPSNVPTAENIRVTNLIKQHGCWTGQAPVGAIPGHVIYNNKMHGAKMTSQILDQMFNHKDYGLDLNKVVAFCR